MGSAAEVRAAVMVAAAKAVGSEEALMGVARVAAATAAVAEAVGWAVVVREGAMEEVAKVAEVETQLGSRRWGPR